ncbi:MAG TPA: hypothetical protein VJB14_16310 [Planctomycetota bacterium]|nr:hypothetical protein [Planctomycetota bacterium]
MKSLVILAAFATLAPTFLVAQDYKPISPACVVDGGEVRPGMTAKYVYEGTNYVVGFCCTGCRTKFLQAPGTYMAQAIAAKANPPPKKEKEKKVSPAATGPCDLKRIVKVPYCAGCARELGKDDLRNGICKRCEIKPATIEYCVKTGESYYMAEGRPETKSEKPFVHEGKLINIPRAVEEKARVVYRCESCDSTADVESEFKHKDGCKPRIGGLKKSCPKSGTAPHATDKK